MNGWMAVDTVQYTRVYNRAISKFWMQLDASKTSSKFSETSNMKMLEVLEKDFIYPNALYTYISPFLLLPDLIRFAKGCF
jgi:hypothetical protein